MLKKITFTVSFGMALNGIVCADNYIGKITIPCEVNKWSLNVNALYLKPVYNTALNSVLNKNASQQQQAMPKWSWGYRIEGVYNSGFNGLGPVMGVDYSYHLASGLSLAANTAGSLLYGSARYSNPLVFNNGLVSLSDYRSAKNIVPSLVATLAASYVRPIGQGMLNIEGGYQVVNYFNGLLARSNGDQSIVTSDFGLYGPYFGLKWLG